MGGFKAAPAEKLHERKVENGNGPPRKGQPARFLVTAKCREKTDNRQNHQTDNPEESSELLLLRHIAHHAQLICPICAELTGNDACSALGIVARGNAPVLGLCRKLVEAGHDPDRALEAFRGTTLCLRVRSIGEAVALEINSAGTGFIGHRALRPGSSMRSNGRGRQ